MDEENSIISPKSSDSKGILNTDLILTKLEDLLNLLRSNADPESLSKYSKFLKEISDQESLFKDGTVNAANIINECLKITASNTENQENMNEREKGLYLELKVILLTIKLNYLSEDDIEYNNTVLTIINNSPKLLNFYKKYDYSLKAENYVKKCKELLDLVINKYPNSKDMFISKIFLDKKMLLDMHNIEIQSTVGKPLVCLDEVQQIRKMLPDFPNHQDYFVRLCYNIGVKLYKKELFHLAITVLEAALSVDRNVKAPCDERFSIVKLLTHIYLKHHPERNWEKCLNQINLLPQEERTVLLPLALKAALFSNNQSTIKEILNRSTEAVDISISLILNVVEELEKNGCEKIAADYLRNIREKTPKLEEKLCLMGLELQICFKINYLERANSLIEDSVVLVKSQALALEQASYLCKPVFSYADNLFKANSFMQSLTWYKKLLKLLEATKMQDAMSYLQQRICLCYLELNEGELAKQAFTKLEWSAPDTNLFQVCLALQVAIVCEDEDLAGIAFQQIDGSDQTAQKVLLACCRKAFFAEKKAFTSKLLETVAQKFCSREGGIFHLKLYQCLIRYHLATAENEETQSKILAHLTKALEALNYAGEEGGLDEVMKWFCRVAWNLALKPGVEIGLAFEFFYVCCGFLEKAKDSSLRLRNTLVFTAAAGVQVLRKCGQNKAQEARREKIARRIFTAIDTCRRLERDSCNIISLLYVYEFETKVMVQDSSAEVVLKQMVQDPLVDDKILEMVASIAYEQSWSHHQLITHALKGAINKIMGNPVGDYDRISQLYHSLLQVLFFTQEYITSSVEEENLNVCNTLHKMLDDNDDFQEYPEMKILWLMAKCWNWGIQILATDRPESGHEWCSLAMKFLHKLRNLKHLHEEKLQALFSSYFGTSTV